MALPGDMKQCPSVQDSHVFYTATKEIESVIKKTETNPEGKGKLMVLKSEMKETASFSISNISDLASDKKTDKVNCDIKVQKSFSNFNS